jgi:predicted transcriptional regulator
MTTLETKVVLIEKRLEELEETIEILGDKKTTRSIERGLRDLQQGRFRKYENVNELLKGIKHG